MKITNVKAMVAKVMTVGLVACAFVMAAPTKAQAQQFSFGVNVGRPYYEHDRRDFYDRARDQEYYRQQEYLREQAYARQQAWAQHEAWEQHERNEAWEGQRRDYRNDDRRDRDDHR